MGSPQAGSVITLRALSGEPLADEAVRNIVEATARAVAERQGIEVLGLKSTPSSLTATLATGRIEALGFAAELRRVTDNWYRTRHAESLWGEAGG